MSNPIAGQLAQETIDMLREAIRAGQLALSPRELSWLELARRCAE